MKRPDFVTKPVSGSVRDKCDICLGTIVETFVLNSIGNYPVSFGIGCNKRGHQYGAPIFKKYDLSENPTLKDELLWELQLEEGKLKRDILLTDLPHSKNTSNISLEALTAGTVIYVDMSKLENKNSTLMGYKIVQLWNKPDADTIVLSDDCFE